MNHANTASDFDAGAKAERTALIALILELAGPRPALTRDGEEPVWSLDVFALQRRLSTTPTASIEPKTAGDSKSDPEVLSKAQMLLVEWLGKEDFSSYGECRGEDLDFLVRAELAEITHPDRGDHALVSLTGAGRFLCHLGAEDNSMPFRSL